MGVAAAQPRFFTNHPRQKHKASTARENARILSRHFLPRFQGRDLASVTAPDLLQVLDRLQGIPTARQRCAPLRVNDETSGVRIVLRIAQGRAQLRGR